MRDVIPAGVFGVVGDHVRQRGNRAHELWQSASEDEDALTGDFCGQLRRLRSRPIRVNGHNWYWSVNYRKFRGRGRGAFEKGSGADGIVTVEVWWAGGELVATKSLLFQAKKGKSNAGLSDQVAKMERLVPNGSAVFRYGEEGFTGVAGHRFESNAVGLAGPKPIGDFLADEYLECKVGARGVYYDSHRHVLVSAGTPEPTVVRLRERVLIEVVKD